MEALIYKGLEGVGFTEANPDKGTETIYLMIFSLMGYYSLQKLTPIRGRKPLISLPLSYVLNLFTEANPDKGTETLVLC